MSALSAIDRRTFLALTGTAAAAASAAGCGRIRKFLRGAPSPSEQVAHRGPTIDVFSICDNCVNKCGVIARVSSGRLVKLDPNPHFPKSRSMLCAKGNAGVQTLYDPDRLKHPLIRVGERGAGKWRKASWDEALDLTAAGLRAVRDKYGPQGVLFSSSEAFQERFFRSFGQAFGSPNSVRHPSMCLSSGNIGFFITYGTVPEFDIEHSRYVIASGANRFESFITPDTMDLAANVRARRTKLVYLDPRFTATAAKADEWLPIRPGTDLAFYLALIHVLIAEQLYDHAFVDTFTHGFGDLATHIETYTPEWAEKETEIQAGRIRAIAREFAAHAPRAVIYRGRRSSWYTNDTEMRQAMAIANALVGNWDTEGGVVPNESIGLGAPELPEYPFPDVPRVDAIGEHHPLANVDDGAYIELRDAVMADTPYPVRGWMIYKQNPMHILPDRRRTEAMFRKMDFVAVIDIVPSDSAWLADVILPESTYLERNDPLEEFNAPYPFVGLRQQVVPPLFNTRPNLEIMQGLASRLGLSAFFDFDINRYIADQLAPIGITRRELAVNGVWTNRSGRKYGATRKPDYRFRTPSGKIELTNERLRRNGYDPLPRYQPPAAAPAGMLRLLPGKQAYFTHAANQNNAWLHELCPENRVWINRGSAAARGIADGNLVVVRSPIGEVRLKAWVTDRIRPDCVHLPHGFGQTSPGLTRTAGAGASDQDLIEPRSDRISGNAALHETFVTVDNA
ncbi:MAG: molybdopterin-dependent oxidoreductase [Acidobacteria bacterium]|nr:molybdopterin-dependent oxidoreductase [Acidobacteriota bacterium]